MAQQTTFKIVLCRKGESPALIDFSYSYEGAGDNKNQQDAAVETLLGGKYGIQNYPLPNVFDTVVCCNPSACMIARLITLGGGLGETSSTYFAVAIRDIIARPELFFRMPN